MSSREIRTALEDAITASEPPMRGGPDDVFVRAKRIGVRQRLTVGGSAVGVLAVLALVATNVGFGQRSADPVVLQPGSPATTVAASAKPQLKSALEILKGLLPAGTVVTESSDSPGYADVVIKDSRGLTFIIVNVQPNFWDPAIFKCKDRHLPSGTKCTEGTTAEGVRTIRSEGPYGQPQTDKLVVQRQVDILYPDALRVVVTEWNATDPKRGQHTRPSPQLSLEQIAVIAMDPKWCELDVSVNGSGAPTGK